MLDADAARHFACFFAALTPLLIFAASMFYFAFRLFDYAISLY